MLPLPAWALPALCGLLGYLLGRLSAKIRF